MALDTRIPMMGVPLDTASPLMALSRGIAEKQRYDQEAAIAAEKEQYARQQDAQKQAMEQEKLEMLKIKQQYDSASEDEKKEAKESASKIFMLDQIKGDPAAVEKFINDPKNMSTTSMLEIRDEYMQDQEEGKPSFMQGVSARNNLSKALGILKETGGTGRATAFSATMAEIDADPELSKLPTIDKIRLAQNKLGTDITLDASTGKAKAMPGAPEARGALKGGEQAGEQRAKQKEGDIKALPLLEEMLRLNEDTFDLPYSNIAQVPAKLIPQWQKQTTALDLMRQKITLIAIPQAKALGVNPTDKDF